MDIKEENELKETILNRLFETSSHCSFCLKFSCDHKGNRTLNTQLSAEKVLMAINFDRSFHRDKP